MALTDLNFINDNPYDQAAKLSRAVYESDPTKAFNQAPGWTPVSAADLPVSSGTLNDGLFTYQNGSALVAAAVLDGKRTLAIAFRGSDQREDWIQNFRNIDEHAANFTGLLTSADALVSQGAVDQVLLTGHSLGAAVTQVSMDSLPHATQLMGVTFGSPGSSTGGPDDRLVNFRVANDPIPWLGEHRGEIGAYIRSLPEPGQLAAAQAMASLIREDPPVTAQDILATLPYMTSDYALRGTLVELPGSGGVSLPTSISVDFADKLDLSRHGITLYESFMPVRTFGTDASERFDGTASMDDHFGNGGDDTMRGQGANDTLNGNQGDDQLFGDDGNDWLYGGKGNDALFGGPQADRLYANIGDDTIHGGRGADTLRGGQGDDLLYGDRGDDWLWGDQGSDTLTGGDGADMFRFGPQSGRDTIADFNDAVGDRIVLENGIGWTLGQDQGGDAVIVFSSEDSVTLTGIPRDQVAAGWIVTAQA